MSRKRQIGGKREKGNNKKERHLQSDEYGLKNQQHPDKKTEMKAEMKEKGVKTRSMSRSHDHQKHTRVESSEGRKWTSFESTHLRRAVTFIPEDHQDFWELVQQMVMTKTKEECQEQHQKDIAKERKRPSVHLLPAEDSNHCRDEEYKCQGAEVSRTSRITYKCQVCNEGFSQKSNMQLHLRPHTTRRTCKCDNCGRGFNDKSYRCKNVRIYDTKNVIANRVGRF